MSAIKTLLESDLSEPSQPGGTLTIYVYPTDDVSFDDLADGNPYIILMPDMFASTIQEKRITQVDWERDWGIDILVILDQEVMPTADHRDMAADWIKAIQIVLVANPTLNGTVDHIIQFDNNVFSESFNGRVDWYTEGNTQPASYGGATMTLRVAEWFSFAETVGVE